MPAQTLKRAAQAGGVELVALKIHTRETVDLKVEQARRAGGGGDGDLGGGDYFSI